MRDIRSWISYAATAWSCFVMVLLLPERPHGGCQAACHFKTRIPSQASVAAGRTLSGPVVGAIKGQQRVQSIWVVKAHNDFSSGLIPTLSTAIQAEATPAGLGSSWAISKVGPLSMPSAAAQAEATPARLLALPSAAVQVEASPGGPGFSAALSEEYHEAIETCQPPTPAPTPGPVFYCMGAISEAEYQALQDLYLATGGAN